MKTAQEMLQERLESLYEWITKQKTLLSQSDKLRIVINVKGSRVVGEITQFPEN